MGWLVGTVLTAILSAAAIWAGGLGTRSTSPAGAHIESPAVLGPFDRAFLENVGEIRNPDIRFFGAGQPEIGLGQGFILLSWPKVAPHKGSTLPLNAFPEGGALRVRLTFEGANKGVLEGRQELLYPTNFFLSSDPNRWYRNVGSYGEVLSRNLYDGIDVTFYRNGSGLKFDFSVRPGADPGQVRIAYGGVSRVELQEGGVVLGTSLGDVRDAPPVARQGARPVPCAYVPDGPFSVRLRCTGWDPHSGGIIDPMVYGTFLGGESGDDGGISLGVDAGGNACVVGDTLSYDFDPGLRGPEDVFVARMNAAGNGLLYLTFLGGSGSDRGRALVMDGVGNCDVTGSTESPDFPVVSGFDRTLGGPRDAFAAKLSPNGDLLYSTFLGGSGDDQGLSIALAPRGAFCVAGLTTSLDFPVTPGAVDPTLNDSANLRDAFLVRVNSSGSLDYATYLGGSAWDSAQAVAVDASGMAWLAGTTFSPDFPLTPDAADRTNQMEECFVARIDMDAGVLMYSTYLGGGGQDAPIGLALDSGGSVYVTGYTDSPDFPLAQNAYNGGTPGDAFLARLGPTGVLLWSRFLGGTGFDDGLSVSVDPLGTPWVSGETHSYDFPTTSDALNLTHSPPDGFVTEVAPSGSAVLFSTYLGGSAYDNAWSLAFDSARNLYVTGGTMSSDFPVTAGAFKTTHPGINFDAFVVKLGPASPPPLPDFTVGPGDLGFSPAAPMSAGTSVAIGALIHNVGNHDASQVGVKFYDGPPSPTNGIGAEQVIPFIAPSGGTGIATVMWRAGPPGAHTICAVVDPDSKILESNETNNEACVSIQVTPAPLPDLTIRPADFRVSPASPVANGTMVYLNATVRNVGNASSGPTVVRFLDGPPPSPSIGSDQPIGALAVNGTESVSVTWTASPPGSHDVCVVVDPDDLVAELNETNNTACADVAVVPPPITRPDYVPSAPQPASPARVGRSLPLGFSLAIENVGNGTAIRNATLALYNASTPSTPFATFQVPPLAPSETSARFIASWISPATPGAYQVAADVDFGNDIVEWNETNNQFVWTVDALAGPVTDLVVGTPNVTAPSMYVTSATSLSFFVLDQGGSGIRFTDYRVDYGTWVNYTATGPFTLSTEGNRYVEWFSEDRAGNVEPAGNATLLVDDTAPATRLSVGDPKYLVAGTHVTSATPFTLQAADAGVTPVGVASTGYRLDGGAWRAYVTPFAVPGDGTHLLEYRSTDRLGHAEATGSATLFVDDLPPAVTVDVGAPRYAAADLFVSSATPIALSAADGGASPAGMASMEYDTTGVWIPYTAPFTLAGADGPKTVAYRATDYVGNVGWGNLTVALDDTPPVTTISPGGGTHARETPFMLAAADAGSGPASTEYRVDGGTWTPYAGAFAIPEGDHTIGFRSTDRLGNAESERTAEVRISGAPGAAGNWKPLVAAVFAAILAVAGAWASRKRPWKSRSDRSAILLAFVLTSLPFVAAEGATGVVSSLTGLLSIPPVLGVGAAVDGGILLAGLVATGLRVRGSERDPELRSIR